MIKFFIDVFSRLGQLISRGFFFIVENILKVLRAVSKSLSELLHSIWGKAVGILLFLFAAVAGLLQGAFEESFQMVISLLPPVPSGTLSSLFPANSQALAWVAWHYGALDQVFKFVAFALTFETVWFTARAGVWGARKVISIVRGSGT